jgi:cation:H+ antiporter
MDHENESKLEHAPDRPDASRKIWLLPATAWTVAGIVVAAAGTIYALKQLHIVTSGEQLRIRLGSFLAFSDNALITNIIFFVVAGVVVWLAGTKLTSQADVIARRTGLGHALVGVLLLATATSLPEIATVVTGVAIGNPELVTGNLLGGVLMQTTVLAAMDLLLVRRGVLTYFAPDAKLLINGVMLVALLGLVIAGVALGSPLSVWSISLASPLIFACYVLTLWSTYSERAKVRWQPILDEPQPEPEPSGARRDERKALDGQVLEEKEAREYRGVSNRRLYGSFALGAIVILVAGYVVARVSDALAEQTGLGSTFVGAVLLAVATSLPEISTTAKAVRLGAYSLAISNIFGSNAFNASLLFPADLLYRPAPILEAAGDSVIFLAGLAIFATCAHLWGILERKNQTVLGMGVGSAVVLLIYIGGMAVLYFSGLGGAGSGAGG